MTIYDIIAKAESLKTETALDSITPKRVGEILVETLNALNEYQIQSGGLSIQKIYDSISAMQSDLEPISDLTGRPLRRGQLVVIVPAYQDDPTAGDVYRYNGSLSWTYVAKIGGSLGESDFYVIHSFTADDLYNEYVQGKHYAAFQHQFDEAQEVWDAIIAGKKIAVRQSKDYPGYAMAMVANKDDYAYIVFPYWTDGFFSFTIEEGVRIEGFFIGSVNAENLESYLNESEKLTELSEEVSGLKEQVPSVFEAVYGETLYEDIVGAYLAGKHCLCVYNNQIYNLVYVKENDNLLFSCSKGVYIYSITVTKGSLWWTGITDLQVKSNKVTTLSSSSTDTQYPSAKAVYDALQNVGGVVWATYGTTSYDEIIAAHNEGKVVLCYFEDTWVARLEKVQSSQVMFQAYAENSVTRLLCKKTGGWSSATYSTAHNLKTLDNGNVEVTIGARTAAVATPQYVENAIQQSGGGGEDTWQVLELNTADIPEDRILLDVGADKYITDVDIDLAFSANTPITEQKEFRLGFLNTTSSGYGNVIRINLITNNNILSFSAKYIGECVNVKNVKVSRVRSGWAGTSTNTINEQGNGSGWAVAYQTTSISPSIADAQNRRYLQIYNYFSKDTLVFAWVRIKYKTANV